MAIDAGTGSCRAVVFDGFGEQVAFTQREWSHPAVPGVAGSQAFDTKTNWELICQCTRQVLQGSGIAPEEVRAVSATSMREGVVLYDEYGREIWACPNADSRAIEEAEYLVSEGLAERIYRTAGDWVAITSPPRLLWLREHEPRIFEDTAHLTMLSDWVLQRLSGRFATDPSVGSSSGMFDLEERTWSPEIIDMCGMRREVFPAVEEPGTVVGEVTQEASKATGLQQGTPVVLGGADTQLALIGLGTTEPNRFTVVGGTFWQHAIALPTPLIDPEGRLRTLCHALPGQWMMEGIGFLPGLTLRWFRDGFCQHEVEQANQRGIDAYALMDEQAMEVPPGSRGVLGIFSNIMNAKRWMHASPSFIQFDITSPAESGKKECIRAIEESAAYVMYGHKQTIESLTQREFDEITFAGGAAKSRLWPQILADVANVRVSVPAAKESTALGAALYAGVGVGIYESLEDAVERIGAVERVYEPDPEAHEQYRSSYETWTQVYAQSLEMVEAGLVQPLWRAAGT